MRRRLKWLVIIVALWAAWDVFWPMAGVPQTFPWELAQRMEAGESLVVLDVRTAWEHEWFHVPGAVHAPFPVDGEALARPPHELGRDIPLVIACMTGHRSQLAAKALQGAGFTRVSNLTWGTVGWVITGGETE